MVALMVDCLLGGLGYFGKSLTVIPESRYQAFRKIVNSPPDPAGVLHKLPNTGHGGECFDDLKEEVHDAPNP